MPVWINKTTITLALIISAVIWFTFYVSSKEKKAIAGYIQEQMIAFDIFIEGDYKNGQKIIKDNGNLTDNELNNSLCGGSNCTDSDQLPAELGADRVPDAGLSPYPEIITGIQIRPKEQQRQSDAIHEEMQCSDAMMADCAFFPECCEIR